MSTTMQALEQLLAAARPLVAMTLQEAGEKDAAGIQVMYCEVDVLNACWDGRPSDKPGRHWNQMSTACGHCNLRAAIAAATGSMA